MSLAKFPTTFQSSEASKNRFGDYVKDYNLNERDDEVDSSDITSNATIANIDQGNNKNFGSKPTLKINTKSAVNQ